jgi:hypothetical protein
VAKAQAEHPSLAAAKKTELYQGAALPFLSRLNWSLALKKDQTQRTTASCEYQCAAGAPRGSAGRAPIVARSIWSTKLNPEPLWARINLNGKIARARAALATAAEPERAA